MARVLTWGTYLACSWTWCIGMFLPVLLMRDYGGVAFAVFAVPNVIGAGAMGWVLSRPGASEAFVSRHRVACEAFSAVTRAFQAFFFFWLLLLPGNIGSIPVMLGAAAAGLLVFARPRTGERTQRIGSVVLWLASAAVLAVLASRWLGNGREAGYPSPERPLSGLLGLEPVVIFGFLLCPYLDLTFHRARQGLTARGATWAFSIGFGIMFLAMIVLTALYGPWLAQGDGAPVVGSLPDILEWLVAGHVVLQLAFTFGVHGTELGGSEGCPMPRRRVWMAAVGVGIVLGIAAAALDAGGGRSGEAIYRCFMAFYGLVFPAYVWIVAIMGRGEPRRRAMRRWAMAVGMAAPMYAIGFIGREEGWLVPGLLVVLLAGVVGRPRDAGIAALYEDVSGTGAESAT